MSKRYRQLKRNRHLFRTGVLEVLYYNSRQPQPAETFFAREEFDRPDVCWCGVKNPYFALVPLTCGGAGIIDCLCGGDMCVCHNHGEVDCDGCEDCQGVDWDNADESDEPWDNE